MSRRNLGNAAFALLSPAAVYLAIVLAAHGMAQGWW